MLGGLVGAVAAWGSAAVWAKGKVLVRDEQHQADLDRLAVVTRLQLDAVRRGLDIDAAEMNLFQELAAKHKAERPGVLPIRGKR